jgi:hypothetical protein
LVGPVLPTVGFPARSVLQFALTGGLWATVSTGCGTCFHSLWTELHPCKSTARVAWIVDPINEDDPHACPLNPLRPNGFNPNPQLSNEADSEDRQTAGGDLGKTETIDGERRRRSPRAVRVRASGVGAGGASAGSRDGVHERVPAGAGPPARAAGSGPQRRAHRRNRHRLRDRARDASRGCRTIFAGSPPPAPARAVWNPDDHRILTPRPSAGDSTSTSTGSFTPYASSAPVASPADPAVCVVAALDSTLSGGGGSRRGRPGRRGRGLPWRRSGRRGRTPTSGRCCWRARRSGGSRRPRRRPRRRWE